MRGGGFAAPAPGPQTRGAGFARGFRRRPLRLNPERERGRGALPPGRPGSGAPKFLPRAVLPPRNAGICWVGRGKGPRTRHHQTRAIGSRWPAGSVGFVSSAPSLQSTPSTFQSVFVCPDFTPKGFMSWSPKAKAQLRAARKGPAVPGTEPSGRRGASLGTKLQIVLCRNAGCYLLTLHTPKFEGAPSASQSQVLVAAEGCGPRWFGELGTVCCRI